MNKELDNPHGDPVCEECDLVMHEFAHLGIEGWCCDGCGWSWDNEWPEVVEIKPTIKKQMTDQEKNAARYQFILNCEDESVCELISQVMFEDVSELSTILDKLIEEKAASSIL